MSTSEHLELPVHRRGGRMPGAEGYHHEDIVALLRCARHVLPVTTEDWSAVLDEYRKTHAEPKGRSLRDAYSLKVKFKQLARSCKPGKLAHPNAQEASAIVDLIKAKLGDGGVSQRRGGRVKGAEGFSSADTQAILDVVRRILPVHMSDWEQVAAEYCKGYAVPNDRVSRDGFSLRHKFRNYLRDDGESLPRPVVTEAQAIQASIVAKTNQLAVTVSAQLEDIRGHGGEAATPVDDVSGGETEAITKEEANTQEKHTSGSETVERPRSIDLRRGGRVVGAEGYSQSDKRALLACIKQVLPVGPASWEQVLQLYRMNHCIPNNRSQRNLTGIKTKFRQLVYRKGKEPSEEVLEARFIHRQIEVSSKLGKHPRSEGSSAGSFPHSPEVSSPGSNEVQPDLMSQGENRMNENLERQNVTADAAVWSVSSQQLAAEPAVKRHKQDPNNVKGSTPNEPESEAVQSEIASRELELLRQREQREAEQAAWEKERSLREKQRMDMEAWTFVCDRLRALYREQSTESDPDIVSEIKDEISILKKKKQRLAGLMV
ncbi:unnamed protein product [Phytophthora fragariaefolia]|uniref:Unnamed protein product n=1 Tax=Phytophthora fragariaefolia TaxID=1490495 RepID=A0A9W6TPK9_9STRA|nr:unnamed protein product [Phytophthora fragariaefolia]